MDLHAGNRIADWIVRHVHEQVSRVNFENQEIVVSEPELTAVNSEARWLLTFY